MSEHEGKRVLVTGSTRNLGKGIAAAFAREGARVAINGTSTEAVAAVARELGEATGADLLELPGDISSESEVEAMFVRIRSAWDGIDILVNNACLQGLGYRFLDTPVDFWNSVMSVNLRGTFLCARAAGRMMREQGGGAIVNVGSNVAKRAIRNRTAYVASKGGIDALTRAMALDLAPYGIRVNTLAPGYSRTGRWDGLEESEVAERRRLTPLGIECDEEDIAQGALYLASNRAKKVTGTCLEIDSGAGAQLVPEDCELRFAANIVANDLRKSSK